MADKRVNIVGEDGKVVPIKAEHLQDALSSGFRAATAEENQSEAERQQYGEGIGNELKAGLAGAARGATFGLSDVIGADFGHAKDLSKLRDYNPTSSVAGEVVGAVAPALLSGGESAVASGARVLSAPVRAVEGLGGLAERGVAKLIGGEAGAKGLARQIIEKGVVKGAGSAVEGALYGAGQVVSEDALGDPDLNAQKAIAHIGLSAVLGGATGGLFAAGSKALGAGVEKGVAVAKDKLGNGKLGEMADDFVEKQAIDALGATQSKVQRLQNKDRLNEVGRDLLTEHEAVGGKKILDKFGDMEKTQANIVAVKEHAGKMKGDALEELSTKAESIGTEERKVIARRMKEAEAQHDAQLQMLEADRKQLEANSLYGSGKKSKLRSVDSEIADLKSAYEQRVGALSEAADKTHESFNGKTVAQRFRSDLMDESLHSPVFKEERNKIAEMVERFRETGRLSLKEADSLKQRLQAEAQRDYDKLTGQYSFAGEMRMKAAALVRQEINEVAARAAQKTSSAEALTRFTEGNRLFGSMSEAEKLIEQGVARKQGNRAISPSDYMAGIGGVVAVGPLGAATSVAHKFIRERGNAVAAHFVDHLRGLSKVELAAQSTTKRITSSIDSFLGVGRTAATALRRSVVPSSEEVLRAANFGSDPNTKDDTAYAGNSDFDRHAKDLAALAADPTRLQDRLAESMSGIAQAAPKTAAAAMQVAITGAAFLNNKLPKPPLYGDVALPSKTQWQPSKLQIEKWTRYVRAIEDPMSVLDDLHDGTIAPESMEALKAVYPGIHKEIVSTIADKYQSISDDMPYQKRLSLSSIIGAPLDETMRPAFVRTMQATYAANPQPQSNEPGSAAVKMTSKGLSNLGVAGRNKTASEGVLTRE